MARISIDDLANAIAERHQQSEGPHKPWYENATETQLSTAAIVAVAEQLQELNETLRSVATGMGMAL